MHETQYFTKKLLPLQPILQFKYIYMGFWNKLFGNNSEQKVGGMEDFMTLIRVYFQAAMAADLGITNLAALPDLRVFKSTLKVATVNNKLGVGERTRCKKMLKEMYGMTTSSSRRSILACVSAARRFRTHRHICCSSRDSHRRS